MIIKIWQIAYNKDTNHAIFLNYENAVKVNGGVRRDIYDCMFVGLVQCKTLEEVYYMFNCEMPETYIGRSLSVSDVVEVIDGGGTGLEGCYFCDSIGFKKVEWDLTTKEMDAYNEKLKKEFNSDAIRLRRYLSDEGDEFFGFTFETFEDVGYHELKGAYDAAFDFMRKLWERNLQ